MYSNRASVLPQIPGIRMLWDFQGEKKCQHHLSFCLVCGQLARLLIETFLHQSLSLEQSRTAGPGIFPFAAGDVPCSDHWPCSHVALAMGKFQEDRS
jgi:hypothetical protein